MIRHTVVFSLKETLSLQEQEDFFSAANLLAHIPGVENFERLKQISRTNSYNFGLSMEFASQSLYDQYNSHSAHVQFIEQYWIPCVYEFLEIDYEPF